MTTEDSAATAAVIDALIVDLYEYDLNGRPDIAGLVAAGLPWAGLVLKASEGRYYNGGTWLETYWPLARSLAGSRYGASWFRGAYHYLRVDDDGAAQAAYYLARIQAVGGWGIGDLWPIVDIERTGQPANASKQQVIDAVSSWAEAIVAATGRAPMLYGGSYLRDLGIAEPMGCQALWVPSWSASLPASSYTSLGFALDNTWAWQYCGDGEAYLAGYPKTTPIGVADISAVIINGGGNLQADLDTTRAHLGTQLR